LTVGQVAHRSGVAISTIHFYEKQGLIEGWRTSGNQRRYHRGVLRRIAIIRIAQRAGVPLTIIKNALADLPHDHVPSAQDWRSFTEAWTGMLDERITALLQLRDQIASCIGCGCLSLQDCPLRNPMDELARLGPGPQCLNPATAPNGRGL